MGVNNFNIGRDCTLVLVANGAILASASLTDFQFKRDEIEIKSRPLNGRVIHRVIPDGYSGSASFDRIDATFDNYFAQLDDAYYAFVNDPTIYISQTMRELNGSISQYRFEGVVLKFDDGGSFKQDDKVVQKISFMAVARRRVS
jgi:hypothetical protein